ncbi:hypothetical protein BD779DRAFT_766129 [Infundibulicybe gibba]|nr:hypothetical protein BD779DRAFT_766129 [Infundibulicybe gibba]
MENLPVEITRIIFIELCPPPTTFPLHEDEPRLLVTHVCSRWRSIALSTPTLWASYYIEFVTFCPAPQSEPIRAWISRTAQSLLSFTFYGSAFEVSPIVSDLVLPIIHRCSLLAFSLNIVTLNRLLTLPPSCYTCFRA